MVQPPTIVFDLIGVLAEPSWRELARAPAGAAWGALKTGRIDEAAFWSPAEAAAFRRALAFRANRLRLLARLRAAGLRIVVATNFHRPWVDVLQDSLHNPTLIDHWIISGELGVAKPAPAFFARVRELAPLGSLFIDDTPANCRAAERAGLTPLWAWPGSDLDGRIDALLGAGAPNGAAP